MQITIAIENMGDGSARARFFKDKESAEAALEPDNERFCDAVYSILLPLHEPLIRFSAIGGLIQEYAK